MTLIETPPETQYADPLAPGAIVAALDRYIVGQTAAKRALAVALRNRIRRQKVAEPLRKEISPKNILLIGPTGVGKTELARRLADLTGAPFLKVDATKFTEVGYVGRDVDSMVRDLIDHAIQVVRAESEREFTAKAEGVVREKLLDLLHPYPSRRQRLEIEEMPTPLQAGESLFREGELPVGEGDAARFPGHAEARAKLGVQLEAGLLDEREVELMVEESDPAQMPFIPGDLEVNLTIQEMMSQLAPKRRRKKRMPLSEARRRLLNDELARALDMERVIREAVERAEESGIIFIDELDKVAVSGGRSSGPEVSREGVQRDLLPLIEGSTVHTKYGPVRTDHILFIAAGAFHLAKPSDLIPELQGRFPIRVELTSLTAGDFERILTEPRNALTRQYEALLGADGIVISFAPDGIAALARLAEQVNESTEDIGARRLHTLLERVLEEVAFTGEGPLVVDEAYVELRVGDLAGDVDLSRYVL